jgi:hypothetical protein
LFTWTQADDLSAARLEGTLTAIPAAEIAAAPVKDCWKKSLRSDSTALVRKFLENNEPIPRITTSPSEFSRKDVNTFQKNRCANHGE